mgnify:CR=1 FL=1
MTTSEKFLNPHPEGGMEARPEVKYAGIAEQVANRVSGLAILAEDAAKWANTFSVVANILRGNFAKFELKVEADIYNRILLREIVIGEYRIYPPVITISELTYDKLREMVVEYFPYILAKFAEVIASKLKL